MAKRVFKPPTVKEVKQYANSLGKEIDAEEFVDFYTAVGWKVPYGKKYIPVVNYQALIRNWVRYRPDIKGRNWKDMYNES